MNILVIAEHHEGQLKPSNLHTLTAAKALGENITFLLIGEQLTKITENALTLPFVKTVLVADHVCYQHYLPENVAPLIAEIAVNYDYVLSSAGTFGKNLLPRVAALLDVSMVSDVSQILSADTFLRPIYAGNVLATVKSTEKIKVLSIRSTAFLMAEGPRESAKIEKLNKVFENQGSAFVSETLTQSVRPELTNAKVIISGGRGLKSAANFQLLEKIADKLNAAIGASRAAVDAGFAPNDYQVGQTGKVVAPDLYIAVGISGAIQHLAGMKDSKIIVAINSDPEAPIFQVADYGLVGDLFQILPELEKALSQ